MPPPDPMAASVSDPDPNTITGAGSASTTPAVSPAGTARYALAEEIARGGMGVVYRATDAALGREIAVKVLREDYGPDSGVARRFADEARITGQLQHPGIPPVHDLGTLPDGRPFLAMKLIKGATLDVLLEARPDPSADRGRFVAVFEQVCQALAYAHSHGVIHRDLKPANVMVGAFGEVQVMDWGLAKVLASRSGDTADPEETTAASRVVSLRDSDGSFTQAGSVLGTPAYMPPEQAVGAVGKVDARSDVFGLGAILAVILTGRPPFAAGSAETLRVLSAQGKLDECFARLDGCGADPELVALCKRCLSPSPSERPVNAGEVARAVADLRTAADERARRAELERVKAEGEKVAAQLQAAEQKKRRRVQLALFAAVGVLVLGGGAFAWWSSAEAQVVHERQRRNAEAVKGLLDQSDEALRGGDAARASVTLEAARKRAAEGGAEASAARLDALAADLALLHDLDAVDQFRWTPLDSRLPDKAAVAARYRQALGRYKADPDAAAPAEAAARASGSAVRDRTIAAWDWLLREQKTAGVRAALQAVDADSYRDVVRDAVRADDREKIADLAARPAALEQPPEFAAFLGESEAISVERRRQLLEAAVGRRPGDLGLLMTLGYTYPINQEEGSSERLRWFQAAAAAVPTAAFNEAIRLDPKDAKAHNGLGFALQQKRDLEGAVAEFTEAIRLEPKDAKVHNNLGHVLQQKGDLERAVAEFREVVRLEPQNVSAHIDLGNTLKDKGDIDGEIAALREAVRLEPDSSYGHYLLAVALGSKGDLDGVVTHFKEVLRLSPNDPWSYNNLGYALKKKGDWDGAVAAVREGVRLFPKNAILRSALGEFLKEKGDLEGAIAASREAIRLDPKDSFSRSLLADDLKKKRDVAGAIAEYKEVVRLDPKNAPAHNSLGEALRDKGDLDGAIDEYKEAVRIDPKNALALSNLADTERMREVSALLPAVLAGEAEPATPEAACWFARLCAPPFQKRYAAAARLYDGAFTADPKLAADLTAAHRYNAACSAVRAAGGEGMDAPADAAAATGLREKALGWLRADLDLHKIQAASADAAERGTAAAGLAVWLADTDLSGVREPEQLAKLPAAEREEWETLWADVKAVQAGARKPPPPAGK